MDNLKYAKKWVDRANTKEDIFDTFVYSYFALNALYNKYYTNSERQAIKTLFNTKYQNIKFQNNIKEIMSSEEFRYFETRTPIKNCRYKEGGSESYDTSYYVQQLAKHDLKVSNKAMLMILYQIRCNLFHGNKSCYEPDDNEIMKNASAILLEYMKAFIK